MLKKAALPSEISVAANILKRADTSTSQMADKQRDWNPRRIRNDIGVREWTCQNPGCKTCLFASSRTSFPTPSLHCPPRFDDHIQVTGGRCPRDAPRCEEDKQMTAAQCPTEPCGEALPEALCQDHAPYDAECAGHDLAPAPSRGWGRENKVVT